MKIFQCTNFFRVTCLHDFFFGLSMNSFFLVPLLAGFFFRQVSLACFFFFFFFYGEGRGGGGGEIATPPFTHRPTYLLTCDQAIFLFFGGEREKSRSPKKTA